MKYLAPICIALFAIGANSAAIAIAEPEPEPICWRPGQPCGKVKRAAEAYDTSIWYYPPGDYHCVDGKIDLGNKTKREAEADAEAAAICWRPGQPCGKAKRAAIALAHAVSNAYPEAEAFFDMHAIPEAFSEPEAIAEGKYSFLPSFQQSVRADAYIADPVDEKLKREAEAICWRPCQPCARVKRAAEAIASALAEPVPEPAPEPICWRPGQPCGKAKRAAEAEAEAICWRPGQPCGKAKRNVDALNEAVTQALANL